MPVSFEKARSDIWELVRPVIAEMLPVVMKVPVAFGSVYVLFEPVMSAFVIVPVNLAALPPDVIDRTIWSSVDVGLLIVKPAVAPNVVAVAVLAPRPVTEERVSASAVKYVAVSIESVPSPPDVLTKPFPVKLESFAMFCVVLTVIVLVVRVSPVENVNGTS